MNDGRMLDDEAAESLRLYALIVRDARATERRHCIKVLEDLRDRARGFNTEAEAGIVAAIEALAPTPPVASSPVGGEQHG